MSGPDNPQNNILLPAASVAVFSRDETTLNSARSLTVDWRFARVETDVHDGDVDTAIGLCAQHDSPSLLIIQTEQIDDNFTQRLEELASHCMEGTSAIVIGPDNDVNLYRRLIDMGVSDYLVRPIEPPVFAEIVAKALIEKLGVSESRLIACVGAKGGTGTTAISQALSGIASDWMKTKTIVLDFAGGRTTLGLGLGVDPSATLSQALRAIEGNDEATLKRLIETVSDNLSILATGSEAILERTVQASQIEVLITALLTRYPLVVIDCSQAPETIQKVVLSLAHNIFLISQPTVSSLRLGRALLQEIKDIRGGKAENIEFIINMQGQFGGNEVDAKQIEVAIDLKPSAILPFDGKSFAGNESKGVRLTQDKASAAMLEKTLVPVMRKILQRVDGHAKETPQKTGLLSSVMSKVKGG